MQPLFVGKPPRPAIALSSPQLQVWLCSPPTPCSQSCTSCTSLQGGNLFQRIYDHSKRRMSYLEILQVRYGTAAVLLRYSMGCFVFFSHHVS